MTGSDGDTAVLRVALCQVDPRVGDLEGNAALVERAVRQAASAGAQLAVLPEQVLIGYPAEDLWLKQHLLEAAERVLHELAPRLPIPALLGVAEPPPTAGQKAWNSCAVVAGGEVVARCRKQHLPNYGVFDEHRWFTAGDRSLLLRLGSSHLLGVSVCEDLWVDDGPQVEQAAAGAVALLNCSASPWRLGRGRDREQLLCRRASGAGLPVLLCNQVGGQDGLVFDGASIAVDGRGDVVARGGFCEAEVVLVDLELGGAREGDASALARCEVMDLVVPTVQEAIDSEGPLDEAMAMRLPGDVADVPCTEHEVWMALQLGLADYVGKNGFDEVVLGVSGGIDSALVLTLAVDALGADRVHAVTMPSQVTSGETRSDAHDIAERQGVQIVELPIEPLMEGFLSTLAGPFEGRPPDLTEENLQARIRGMLLMALSNKLGWLVLATGNRSEVAVGYSTLYGDSAGGFAPIKDVPKTLVWQLARRRNEVAREHGLTEPIPPSTIERPPTAELRSGQRDSDSLPPYDVLDGIVEMLVDRDMSAAEVVAAGYDAAVVEKVANLVDGAEFKRRQSPPGIRVTARAFGLERRMPITSAWRERIAQGG